MIKISVKNFSCLKEAEVELRQMTILIGPQASGKSVLSKLIYFFVQQIVNPFIFLNEEEGFEETISNASLRFKKYFPPAAWGTAGFSIDFFSGPIHMRIVRNKPKSPKSSGNLRIYYGDYFERLYKRLVSELRELKLTQSKAKDTQHGPFSPSWEARWKIQLKYRAELEKDLGSEYFSNLLFVPAGRALFTIMGRAIAAFDSDGFLDSFTRDFGKKLLQVREDIYFSVQREDKANAELATSRERFALELFGGVLKRDRNEEFIEAKDGRRMPFSVLSSGQQELYPLWEALKSLVPRSESSIIFIEEPEAHLFPSAQSMLVLFLAATLRSNGRYRMMVTSHSPYVLAKLNNIIKASQLGQNSRKASAVEKVVPKSSWLKHNTVVAYCIDDGIVKLIMDEGLIDADYLDQVSGEISDEFTRLLQIEAGQ